jgi:hypothetical protein
MGDEAIDRFKLRPTFRDRQQYELAMQADSLDALRARFPARCTQTESLRKIGVTHLPALEASVFFHESMLVGSRQDGIGRGHPRYGAGLRCSD